MNGTTFGSAVTDSNGIAILPYKIAQTGSFNINTTFAGDNVYTASYGTSVLKADPAASLYLKVNSTKNNVSVGETLLLVFKLGNNGPDQAENVTVTFKVPDSLEFQNIAVDSGNWTYDHSSRLVNWTFNSLPVGDPYMFLSVKAINSGNYVITPNIKSNTYNLNPIDAQGLTINVKSTNNLNNGNFNTVKALKLIGMQNTGVPVFYFILAVIIVFGGLLVSRK